MMDIILSEVKMKYNILEQVKLLFLWILGLVYMKIL